MKSTTFVTGVVELLNPFNECTVDVNFLTFLAFIFGMPKFYLKNLYLIFVNVT